MPFASVNLKPGVNTEATATALRAGYAQSNLGRFRAGFFEKLGGWIKYYAFALAGVPRALQAWLDLNGNPWLAIGTTTALDVIDEDGLLTIITPQTYSSDVLTGNDTYTKVLLHFDGADASTTITDSNFGGSSHAWTAQGNAQLDTAAFEFGTASLLLDGSGDYVSTPDSSDFTLGSGDWTVDCWFKCNAAGGSFQQLAGQADATAVAPSSAWWLQRTDTNIIRGVVSDGSGFTVVAGTTQFTSAINTGWHHLALVRTGNVLKLFIDGVQEGSSIAFTASVNNSSESLGVGALGGFTSGPWTGWIDEFRLSVGIARWTANFTPPTRGYYGLFSTTSSSTTVTVEDPNIANVTTYDSVEFLTPIAVGGLILSGLYPIATIASSTSYTITAASAATSSVSSGGAVPFFATTSGSPSVSVTLAAHGLAAGNTIVFPLSTTVGGITIDGTYTVVSVTSSSIFVIAGSSAASSTTSAPMNLGNPEFLYYISLGPASASGTAYSFSTYSSGPYSGTGAGSTAQTGTAITATDWTLDNWNATLMACPADGGIYVWTPLSGFPNASLISGAPIYNSGIFVTAPRLALLAYGSTVTKDIGLAQDPLVYKISDINDYTFWELNVVNSTTGATSQAFESRIPTGSAIRAGLAGPNQVLLWTDLDLWALNYVNLPTIWTQSKIGANCGTVSRHSIAQMAGVIYWRGSNNFYGMAGGTPQVIPCTVWDAVFQNQDTDNLDKCFTETVTSFNEVWFFGPSAASADGNCDLYAKVNVVDGAWDYGSMPRSIGIDQSVVGNPVMATPTGILYSHETGYDADGAPLSPVMTTGEFYLSEGQDFVFVDQFYPDFKFATYDGSTTSAIVQVTFYVKDNPGASTRTYGPYSMSTSTLKLDVRFRGRMVQIAMTSTDVGSFWRLGKPYFRVAPSGRR